MVLVKELQSITRPSISRVDRARARVFGGQLAVNIILENNDIVALGKVQHRALAGVRHDKAQRVIAVWHEDHPFDRPLIQRQLRASMLIPVSGSVGISIVFNPSPRSICMVP